MRVIAVAALAALPSYAAAQAYRCDVDGRVTYSQIPCTHGKVRQVDVPPNKPPRGSPEWAAEQVNNDPLVKELNAKLNSLERSIAESKAAEMRAAERREQIRLDWLANNKGASSAIRRGVELRQVVIGMDATAVAAAIGDPDDTRRSVFPGHVIEWWHYTSKTPRLSVRFSGGIVDSYHE